MILWSSRGKMYLWKQKSRLMERKYLNKSRKVLRGTRIVEYGWEYVPKPLYAHLTAGLHRQIYKGSPYYTGVLSVYVRENRQTIIDKDTGRQHNEIVLGLWVYVFTLGWQSNFYRLHDRWR